MRKRSVAIVSGAVAALMLGAGATAWADTFTPAIEEPVFQLGLLRGTPLGGSVPDGNASSANPGRSYRPGSGDSDGSSSYRGSYRDSYRDQETPEDLYGYWRTGEASEGSADDLYGNQR